MNRSKCFLGTIVLCGLVLGCAGMAIEKERQLSASGFQMKLANTDEKATHLASLPQRKLVPTKRAGELVFVYADAKGCKCMYVGSQADYQRYQQILIAQKQIDEQNETAEELDDASMSWGAWGPWYRPFY